MPKFGFRVITRDADDPLRWGQVIAQARAAEDAGFDRVIVSGDHVVFGEHVDVFLPAPTEYDAAVDYLALWAEAFRKALP